MNKLVLALVSIFCTTVLYANTPPVGCKNPHEVCEEGQATKMIDGIPVHLDCWHYEVRYTCPNWMEQKNSCLDTPNCRADGPPTPITPWHKQQAMTCHNTIYQKICDKYQTKKVCDKGDYTHNTDKHAPPKDTGTFGNMAAYMGAIDAMQKNVSVNPVEIFAGTVRHCGTPMNLGPLTHDCCDENLKRHRSGWQLNNCSADEVSLALARRNLATHEVGTYCAHSLPIIGCTLHKTGYCQFSTMLGRIIEEQGRAQINALAQAGSQSHNAVSMAVSWPLTDTTAHINAVVANGIKVVGYSQQAMRTASLSMVVNYQSPLVVDAGSTTITDGLSVSLSCQNTLCQGAMLSNGQVKDFGFDPTCKLQQKGVWHVGNSTLMQSSCIAKGGKAPSDWVKPLYWNEDGPALWQFALSGSTVESIESPTFRWHLAGETLTGHASCQGESCSVSLQAHSEPDLTLDFPLNCQDSKRYAKTIAGITIAPKCAEPKQIIAVCTTGQSCGPLPDSNTISKKVGATENGWAIRSLAAGGVNQFVTPDIKVSGQCTGRECHWVITSLGVGGIEDMVPGKLTFNLYSAPVKEGRAQSGFAPESRYIETASGLEIRPYQYSHDDKPKDGIKLLLKAPTAQTWIQFKVPLSIENSNPLVLTKNPKTTITGGCNLTTGMCNYNTATHAHIEAMPWGDAQNPKCEGFTLAQMSLINWNKVDLSEYEKYISRNMSDKEKAQIDKQTKAGINDFYHNFNNGGSENAPPPNQQGSQVVMVSPLSGQGGNDKVPFTVTLKAVSNFPQYVPYNQCGYPTTNYNTNPVTSMDINWGDGSHDSLNPGQIQNATFSGSDYTGKVACNYTVPIYIIKHTYGAPDGKTETLPITVTLNAKDGVHKTVINVENEWDNGAPNNDTGGGMNPSDRQAQPDQFPGGGSFTPHDVPGVEK